MNKEMNEIKEQIDKDPENIALVEKYIRLLSDLIIEYSQDDKLTELEKVIQELDKIIDNYSNYKSVIQLYGESIVNSLPMVFAKSTITQVKRIINNLRSKADKTNNTLLTEFLSMVLVNAIYDFSLLNKAETIHEFALELIDLSRKYPTNVTILSAGAKGMMNSTMYFMQIGDMNAARNYYQTLCKIINNSPKKDVVDSRRLIQLKEYFEK
ncbi:MAG: hypothetical protein JXA54_07995 [Candidatus Heimdallarchaeota archaeon]|nr:hypothetical protein [Candidatus Heimdallarchaeota archaeon]